MTFEEMNAVLGRIHATCDVTFSWLEGALVGTSVNKGHVEYEYLNMGDPLGKPLMKTLASELRKLEDAKLASSGIDERIRLVTEELRKLEGDAR